MFEPIQPLQGPSSKYSSRLTRFPRSARRAVFAAVAVLLLLAPSARALRIAAAADLEPVLPPVLKKFQEQTGIKTAVVYASSATLASQILNGAPFDLFLSADFSFPRRVIAGGYAAESQPTAYARGTLVLWARKDAPILKGDHHLSLADLRSPELGKVAIANPSHAPYGRAAVEAIRSLGLTKTLQPKLVIAENIAQAAQFVESGNAEVGFLSLTSAVTPLLEKTGTFVRVPKKAYPPILQGAVIVRNASDSKGAQRFLDFLRSPPIRSELAHSGLGAP